MVNPAETLATGAQDQPADKRSEAFLDGLPQACGNLGRSPVSRCVALRGEIHRGPEYVAARLARPDMPDAAVVDMLRPYRRYEDIAALSARCPVARQGSADRIEPCIFLPMSIL